MRMLFIFPLILMTQLACAQTADQIIKKDATTITVISSKDVLLIDTQRVIDQKKQAVTMLLKQVDFLNSEVDKLNTDILNLEEQFQTVGIDPSKPVDIQPASADAQPAIIP